MSQHDFDITTADANTGTTFRAAVNAALQALASNSSGATEPAAPYAYQFWADTTSGMLKQRNAGNTAWNTIMALGADLTAKPDYASGTFTPVIKGSGTAGTPVYTAQQGSYVKIGKVVYLSLYVRWSAISGSPTGDLQLSGLPFVGAAGITGQIMIPGLVSVSAPAGSNFYASLVAGATTLTFSYYDAAIAGSTTVPVDTAGNLFMNAFYLTD